MNRKNILLWILTVIFLVLAIAFITKAAGVLFMLAAVIAAPIGALQDAITRLIEKYGKLFLVVVILSGAVVLLIPTESANSSDGKVSMESQSTDATASQTEQSTQAMDPTQTVTDPMETEGTLPPTQAPTLAPTEPSTTNAPTQAPTETEPTNAPTQAPTEPPAQSPSAAIVFIQWPEVIQRGTEGTVTIKGEPNTRYSIQVYYKSGPSTAAGLEDQISDENGYVTWTWKVSSRTGVGTFKIVVTGGGATEKVEYTVAEAE